MPNATEPVVFPEVADVLAAATAPATPTELAGEAAALASFRSAQPDPAGTSGTGGVVSGRWKAALAAVAACSLLGAGGAAAAAGALPEAAQDATHGALAKVGVDVPRGKGLATAPGQQKDKDKDKVKVKDKKAKDGVPPEGTAATPATGQGATISSIAQNPALSGVDKGAAVSAEASDGKSHAGQRPVDKATTPPASVPVGPAASSPGATAPGRATASTAGPRNDTPTAADKGKRP